MYPCGGLAMSFFMGLSLVFLLWACGEALLPLTSTAPRSRWESFSISFLLGAAVWTVTCTAFLALGIPFILALSGCLLGSGSCFALWGFSRRQGKSTPLYTTTALLPWQKILLGTLGCLSLAVTLSLPINEFDPLLHFAYKGKVLHFEGSPLVESLTGMMAQDDVPMEFGRMVTHPNYPLGVPILEAFTSFGTSWSDRWAQWPLALWALCIPGAVFFGLRRYSLKAAGHGALLAACTPILYFRHLFADGFSSLQEAGLGNTMTLGAGADLPTAAMLTLACALSLRARWEHCRRLGILSGLALAGLVMMKNEGLALLGIFILAGILAGTLCPKRCKGKVLGVSWLAVGVGILGILPWLLLRAELPAIDENYSSQISIERITHFLAGGEELVDLSPKVIAGQVTAKELLAETPSRPIQLLKAFGREFVDVFSWGLLWLLVLLSIPWRRWKQNKEQTWLALLVLGGLSLYALILLVTPWYLPLLLEKGIPDRLMLHLLGPAAMLAGIGLSSAKPATTSTCD